MEEIEVCIHCESPTTLTICDNIHCDMCDMSVETKMAKKEENGKENGVKNIAIEFAIWITDQQVFDDFCFMDSSTQNGAYEQFIKERKKSGKVEE